MAVDPVTYEPLTKRIIGAAIEVHRHLGPGLLESVYQECLARELAAHRLSFVTQQSTRVSYKGVQLAASFRLDLVVEGLVVVEIKSVTAISAIHQAQALTYMRIADCPVGLVINFNVPRLIDGVKRLVNARVGENRGDAGAEETKVRRISGTEDERSRNNFKD